MSSEPLLRLWRWRLRGVLAEGGLLVLPIGLAVDDEFPRGALHPVDSGLCAQWVGHDCQPFARVAIRSQHGRCRAMPLDHELIVVQCLCRTERGEREVVDDQEIDDITALGCRRGDLEAVPRGDGGTLRRRVWVADDLSPPDNTTRFDSGDGDDEGRI